MTGLLGGRAFTVDPAAPGGTEAADLLRRLGATVAPGASARPMPPATTGRDAAWAASGAMSLTGRPDGPPLAPGAPVASRLQGAATVLELLSGLAGRPVRVDGPALLGERAALAGLTRRGDVSPGGSSRLLPCADGWVAVNLARPDDVDLLAAWLLVEGASPDDPWPVVARAVRSLPGAALAERAALLGLPAAEVAEPDEAAGDAQSRARGQAFPLFPFLVDGQLPCARVASCDAARPGARPGWAAAPLVVDLTSMWAGPLCANLLGLAGARVVKVEATGRPDGARRASYRLFDLLHAGHESVALDFSAGQGVAALHRLVGAADIVLEASRPRALVQLGLDPAAVLAAHPTLTWVSVTGYGRTGPWAGRVAFGDDAAAAAGLVAADGTPVFCGDAVADPAAGLYAAIGALASWLDGGGHLVDVAMRDAAGHLLAGAPRRAAHDRRARRAADGEWVVDAGGTVCPVAPPRHRPLAGRAAPLGAHTRAVLAEVGAAPV